MRLGHYWATAVNGSEPDLALLWEAADGIRTHDLLHGKQSRGFAGLYGCSCFGC